MDDAMRSRLAYGQSRRDPAGTAGALPLGRKSSPGANEARSTRLHQGDNRFPEGHPPRTPEHWKGDADRLDRDSPVVFAVNRSNGRSIDGARWEKAPSLGAESRFVVVNVRVLFATTNAFCIHSDDGAS
jgi:hypothetical protein